MQRGGAALITPDLKEIEALIVQSKRLLFLRQILLEIIIFT